MPRLRRVEVDGAIYLVTARGEATDPLFQDPQDYDTYLKLLAEGQSHHAFKLFAYCLLPDMVLLALEPAVGSTLSEIMHDLTTTYSRYANKRHARTGPLFRERFKQTIVESETHLLPLTTYLHLLPVQRGLAQEAQGYPFSSAQRYANPGSAVDRLDVAIAPQAASPEQLARISPAEQQQLQRLFASRIVGSPEFVSRVNEELVTVRSRPAPEFMRAEMMAVVPALRSPMHSRSLGVVMASLAAVVFSAVVVASLQQQLGGLKQTLLAMMEEREGLGIRYSLAVQHDEIGALASLEGTKWAIRLMPIHAMPVHAQAPDIMLHDSLAFTQRQVSSQTFSQDGFSPSRYTVVVQPDGTQNWETMQVNPSGETVSWQGEWQGPVMRGVLTRQTAGGAPQHFTFVGASQQPTADRSET